LITLSFASTSVFTIANFSVPSGTQVKEVYITSAVQPSLCDGANYAVSFDAGGGPILITQNTEFKFTYTNPLTISGDAQDLTVLIGSIVNAMIELGPSLDNSTIQNIAANGVAQ
jgi:hypothetical protein